MKKYILSLLILIPFTGVTQSLSEYRKEIHLHYSKADYHKGIDLCDQGLKTFDISEDLYYLKAYGLFYEKDYNPHEFWSDTAHYNQVHGLLSKTIEVDSAYRDAWLLRAYLNYRNTYFELAIIDYEYTLSLARDKKLKSQLYAEISGCYIYLNDTTAALQTAQQMIDLDPDNLINIAAVSTMYLKFGLYKESEILLLKALHNAPNSIYLLGNLGYTYLCSGKYEKGIEYYSKAIEIDKKYFYGYSNRGYCYVMIGEYKKGLKDINKSLKLNPGNPFAFKYRAIYYFKTGETEKGCADLQTALEHGYAAWDDEVDQLMEEHCK